MNNPSFKRRAPSREPPPSAEDLASLVDALLASARDLQSSGELLLTHGRVIHGYEKFHQAMEELGKAQLTISQWSALAAGKPPQWKLFWRVWRSHELKVMLAMLITGTAEISRVLRKGDEPAREWSMPTEEQIAAGLPRLRTFMANLYPGFIATQPAAGELHAKRMSTVYVDWADGGVLLPADSASLAETQELRAVLVSCLEYLTRAWKSRAVLSQLGPRLRTALDDVWNEVDKDLGSQT